MQNRNDTNQLSHFNGNLSDILCYIMKRYKQTKWKLNGNILS